MDNEYNVLQIRNQDSFLTFEITKDGEMIVNNRDYNPESDYTLTKVQVSNIVKFLQSWLDENSILE